jgi:hypothetical protein
MEEQVQELQTEEQKIRFRTRDLVGSCLREVPTLPEKIVLDDAGVSTIEKEVDRVLDTSALVEVVNAILIIAHYVETELSAPITAQRLVTIVNRAHVLESMHQINGAREAFDLDRARNAAEGFAKLTHRRASIESSAPAFDADDPPGTIKLDKLGLFPKRL